MMARANGGRTMSETDDAEIAAVVTSVRDDFGNKATAVQPGQVAVIRAATASRKSFHIAGEPLKEHPLK